MQKRSLIPLENFIQAPGPFESFNGPSAPRIAYSQTVSSSLYRAFLSKIPTPTRLPHYKTHSGHEEEPNGEGWTDQCKHSLASNRTNVHHSQRQTSYTPQLTRDMTGRCANPIRAVTQWVHSRVQKGPISSFLLGRGGLRHRVIVCTVMDFNHLVHVAAHGYSIRMVTSTTIPLAQGIHRP